MARGVVVTEPVIIAALTGVTCSLATALVRPRSVLSVFPDDDGLEDPRPVWALWLALGGSLWLAAVVVGASAAFLRATGVPW